MEERAGGGTLGEGGAHRCGHCVLEALVLKFETGENEHDKLVAERVVLDSQIAHFKTTLPFAAVVSLPPTRLAPMLCAMTQALSSIPSQDLLGLQCEEGLAMTIAHLNTLTGMFAGAYPMTIAGMPVTPPPPPPSAEVSPPSPRGGVGALLGVRTVEEAFGQDEQVVSDEDFTEGEGDGEVWPDAKDPDDLKDAVQRAKLRFKANTNQDPPDFEGQIAASRAAL